MAYQRGWRSDEALRFWPYATHPQTPPIALPANLYRFERSSLGPYLAQIPLVTDTLVPITNPVLAELINEMVSFWSPDVAARFKAHGFVHKRGILMHSAPGIGKTSLIWQLLARLRAEHDAVALLHNEAGAIVQGIRLIRSIDEQRPIVVIAEDFEEAIENEEGDWLNLLDGGFQADNVVYLATTNHLGKVPKRFRDRPSRFDRIIGIAPPTEADRLAFLKAKAPGMREPEDAARLTDGLTFAHLRELIVWTECFRKPMHQGIENLKKMSTEVPDDDEE